ncbi:winged helix-turn-helix domain-containing protein [Piscinibacter sp. HJYY11]|uniref:winged helix-turn-helix domain-containing protein n=1 Tax=Piscinibacter sp. HJYY11 TaxID=2801333 RepID=UPI00191F4B45|nr:winged helix-turn-helix domain-containing protein [Piscinibacter sp. HJYY11]MBL0730794.1 winged helix-turn-helix domain-containing protein [Piscinibacter sp. HJYY11]
MTRPPTASDTAPRILPSRLAWVGEGVPRRAAVAGELTRFDDSDDFLLAPDAFGYDFYVVHLSQRGVPGLDLVRLIRKRSAAGLVALDKGPALAFAAALDLGADMVLPETCSADELAAAIASVHRRAQVAQAPASTRPWTLVEARSALQAPDGTEISLSASDLVLLQCFAESADGKVRREALVRRLWGQGVDGAMENALHATVYRLRKRIEQAGHPLVPLHSVAKVGYEFRAPLVKA